MNILMLGWELPPHHTGGLGVVLLEIIKTLSKSDANVDVLLPFKDEFEADGYGIHSATEKSASELHFESAIYNSTDYTASENVNIYTEKTVELAKKGDYDVIHAHDWLTFQAAIAAREATGIPVVTHVHATDFDRAGGNSGNPIVHDIEYFGLVNSDAIVAVSERTKNSIVENYAIPSEKVHVVHNRHNVEDTEAADAHSGPTFEYFDYLRAKGYKIVLSAGRITLQKGLPFLLEAAKEALKINNKLMFVFVGNGDMLDEIIHRSADLGISENVLFAGYHNGTGKEWRDAFRQADMFVMPSVSEPFGITPLESLSYDTPALISRQTGSGELLKNVIKFDYWNRDELVNAIIAVAGNDSLAKELACWGKKEVSKLSWLDAVDELKQIYSKVSPGAYQNV